MKRPIVFGSIHGIDEGFQFSDRKQMMENSFHRNWAAGIDGNSSAGQLHSSELALMKSN